MNSTNFPDPLAQELWATQRNPNGFFKEGTRIEVSGAPVKADNGTFVVTKPFPFQPMGCSYHQWERLNADGTRKRTGSPRLRGGNAAKVRNWIDTGLMKVLP